MVCDQRMLREKYLPSNTGKQADELWMTAFFIWV
jgi:hypothetical protein